MNLKTEFKSTPTQRSQNSLIKSALTCPFIALRSFIQWLKSGEAPPKTHKKSMAIMCALLVFGFSILSIWILAMFRIKFYTYVQSYWSFAFMSFITLCPGIYALWITVCCWRRIEGYDWGMIPFFD